MKKLMIAAAAAAVVGGAYAASCAPGSSSSCDALVFSLSGSGKISAENSKETYKTNAKFSPKGYLVINRDYSVEILASFKYMGDKTVAAVGGVVQQLGAYGKNAEKFDDGSYKPGKTYKLDSDLGVAFGSDTPEVLDEVSDVAEIFGYMSTFGKVKAKVSKQKVNDKSTCNPSTNNACEVTWTPVKYTGWFAGEYVPDCIDEVVPTFTCTAFNKTGHGLFGGKVTLKYTSKIDSNDEAEDKFESKYLRKAERIVATDLAEDLEWYEEDEDEEEEEDEDEE